MFGESVRILPRNYHNYTNFGQDNNKYYYIFKIFGWRPLKIWSSMVWPSLLGNCRRNRHIYFSFNNHVPFSLVWSLQAIPKGTRKHKEHPIDGLCSLQQKTSSKIVSRSPKISSLRVDVVLKLGRFKAWISCENLEPRKFLTASWKLAFKASCHG